MARGAERLDRGSSDAYVRVCELAMGGMGRVDLALRREGAFRRLYAVKRLHPHLRNDSGCRAMFLEEARIAGLIRHPNVVSVLDVGEDDQGPYLIMDFVDGLALNTILGLADERTTWIPVQVCVRVAMQVARGLHAAHELTGTDGQPLNLVHRDLSPQNILVSYDGVVRITDFGIAKALGRSVHTSTGMLKGKLGYMSPEQLRFEEPDRRSDLFALGVLLYELLSGTRLYRNERGTDGARRILTEPPPEIREERQEVPESLAVFVRELLAKERQRRPPNAADVAQRLEEVLVELLQKETPAELPDFLDRFAGDVKEEQQRELTTAIERLEAEPAVADPTIPFPRDRIAVDPGPTTLMKSAVSSARARWRRVAAAGAVGGAGLVALAAWSWVANDGAPETGADTGQVEQGTNAVGPAPAGGPRHAGPTPAESSGKDGDSPAFTQHIPPQRVVVPVDGADAGGEAKGDAADASPAAGQASGGPPGSSADVPDPGQRRRMQRRKRLERMRELRRRRRRRSQRSQDDEQGGESGGGLQWEEW